MPVAIGIALACLAASMNATGLNLQRYAQRHGLRVLNAVGLALAVLCGVADMASFGFAPQSLLAPFGSLTLVINLLLAPVLHGDQIRTVDLSSTALVFAGVAICLANGTAAAVPRTEARLQSPEGSWHLLTFCLAGQSACDDGRQGSPRTGT